MSDKIYKATFDVASAIANIKKMKASMNDAGQSIKSSLQQTSTQMLALRQQIEKTRSAVLTRGTAQKKTSDIVRNALAQEKAARDTLNAAIGSYRQKIKDGEKAAVQAGKASAKASILARKEAEKLAKAQAMVAEKIRRETVRATKAAQREAEKLAKSAAKAQQQLKKSFLSIGQNSRSGLGQMIQYATMGTAAFMGLHKVISNISDAKADYFKFDDLTTATLSMTHSGEQAFQYGAEGAMKFRQAIRDAAKDMRVAAGEMGNSALFWAKAGQTNGHTIAELSKVGTMFAKANRDAAGNVLNQSSANDILSDALTMLGKDMSTADKAKEEAMKLGDKMTAAANITNHSIEQLWEFSKKAAPLAQAAEITEDEVFAIAGSLASAGIKAEEPGRLVRRILTQFSRSDVQKILKREGVELETQDGGLRSFGAIFGDIGQVIKKQKPLARMAFLKSIVGQNAISVAAALAGLNDKGETSGTSIEALLKKIGDAEGLIERNRAEQLKTFKGRMDAVSADFSNAIGEFIETSDLASDAVSALERIVPQIIPWLEKFGITFRDLIIPAVKQTYENISEWLSPAVELLSSLFGDTTSSVENLSDAITTMIQLWIKWKVALLAIKGLRMVDWVVNLVTQIKIANTQIKAVGPTTTKAVGQAKTAVGGLSGAFATAGIGIAAAIAAWGLYELLTEPVRRAEDRIKKFKIKYGEGFEQLKTGDENVRTLASRVRDAEKSQRNYIAGLDASAMSDPEVQKLIAKGQAEVDRLKQALSEQAVKQYGADKTTPVILPDQSEKQVMSWVEQPKQSLPVWALEERYSSAKRTGTEGEIKQATDGLIDALQDQGQTQQQLVDKQKMEMIQLAQELGSATADRTQDIITSMDALGGRLSKNEEALRATASRIGDLMNQGVASDRKKDAQDKADKKYKSTFKGGGRSKQLDPYSTPILTSVDREGQRRVHLATHNKNVAAVFQESPQLRQLLTANLQKRGVTNVYFGDNTLTVKAKSDASPEQIARVVNREMRRVGKQQEREVQRIIRNKRPAQI